MQPIDWAVLPFKRYFEFSGRSCRREFWWFTLATTIVGFGLDGLDYAFGTEIGWIGLGYTLLTMIPSLSVTIRRLHDINLSGWWLWILIAPAIAWGFLGSVATFDDQFGNAEPPVEFAATILTDLATWIIPSILLFIVMALPGTKGLNRFGSQWSDIPEPSAS